VGNRVKALGIRVQGLGRRLRRIIYSGFNRAKGLQFSVDDLRVRLAGRKFEACPKPKTQNPKPKTQNPKTQTQTLKPKTQKS